MSDFWNVFYWVLIGLKTTRLQSQTHLVNPELMKVSHILLLWDLTRFSHGDVYRSPPTCEGPISVPLSGVRHVGNIKGAG